MAEFFTQKQRLFGLPRDPTMGRRGTLRPVPQNEEREREERKGESSRD